MVVSTKGKMIRSVLTVLCVSIGITMLLPLIWMLSTSFKYEADVFTFPIEWIPKRTVKFDNYKEVWEKPIVLELIIGILLKLQ